MKKAKKIRISVYWPDDWKSVVITQKQYQSILDGKPLKKDGEGYSYEGEEFSDWWTFEGGADSKVIVNYSGEGVGFEGALSDCEIEDDED